jgi:protein SCO1/2
MNESAKSRFLQILSLVTGLMLAACSPAGGSTGKAPLEGAKLGGSFTLTDQFGRVRSDRDFAGRYRIVYFGFSHCPDICPTDLAAIGAGLEQFEKADEARAQKVVPIFITVDPERDTPAALKEYAAAFHPRLVALTGTAGQIQTAARAYGIAYAKGPPAPGGGYGVDHSRYTILFGPEGKPITFLPSDKGPQGVAEGLDRWVR